MRSVHRFMHLLTSDVCADIDGDVSAVSIYDAETLDSLPAIQWVIVASEPVRNGDYGKGHLMTVTFTAFAHRRDRADELLGDFMAALHEKWRSGYRNEAGILSHVEVVSEGVYQLVDNKFRIAPFAASLQIVAR